MSDFAYNLAGVVGFFGFLIFGALLVAALFACADNCAWSIWQFAGVRRYLALVAVLFATFVAMVGMAACITLFTLSPPEDNGSVLVGPPVEQTAWTIE